MVIVSKYIVKNSNTIIVNSNLEKKNVKKLVKNKKVYVVPHGINKIDYLKKRTVNKDTRFVFFSRIHPVKNLKRLVEIWVNNKFFDNKVLDIYGDISDKDYFYQINKIILNKKNIFYKELYIKKKTLTLSKYDVFLFPSISENFGLVILEALSAGLYLIINQTLPWKKLEKKQFATISNFRTNNLINAIKSSQRKISSKNRKKENYEIFKCIL